MPKKKIKTEEVVVNREELDRLRENQDKLDKLKIENEKVLLVTETQGKTFIDDSGDGSVQRMVVKDPRLDKVIPLLVATVSQLCRQKGMGRHATDLQNKIREVMDGTEEDNS